MDGLFLDVEADVRTSAVQGYEDGLKRQTIILYSLWQTISLGKFIKQPDPFIYFKKEKMDRAERQEKTTTTP
jgi:hypothetical protein